MFFLPSETTAVGRTVNIPLNFLSKWKGWKVKKKEMSKYNNERRDKQKDIERNHPVKHEEEGPGP